ncbi:hypothetical protein CMV_025891 [Castanea mollissima]|uniref:Disease resistance N-terminal domain-containing protein n=1 Tax=Castanea mollissima TaxID=60419 RepID=A0A8J4QET7_9ROSI|nr:hypothetical protein CMV_025891 [Castanea mollissima]
MVVSNPNKKLKGASTSSKAEERKIGSTSISKDDTLSGLFKKSKEEYKAEIMLNVVVEGLLAKLRSNVIEHHISLERGFKEGLIDLLILLTQIQLVLNDVEKRQVSDEFLRSWSAKLRDVAYDIDDVLDEFGYKILQQKVLSSYLLSNSIVSPLNMAENIKTINESLNILKDDIASYDLRAEFVNSIPEISFNMEIDSFLDDSKVNQNVGNNIIYLNRCTECEEVPTLGHLPSLRILEIFGLWKVRSIGSEFYSYSEGSHRNTTALFQALRILKLLFMSSLEEWKGAKELTSAGEVLLVFACLEELIIRGCNKLRDFPDSVHTCISLQKFVVQDCPKLRSLLCVPSITTLPSGVQCYTSSVEYMENRDCLSSTSSIHPSLQKLKLYGSVLFLDQIQYFIALKILWIQEFGEIVALPEWLGNLSSLQELYIVDCKNLVHLSAKETMQRFTKLKTVMINGCPKLNNQIDHNPFIQFPYS